MYRTHTHTPSDTHAGRYKFIQVILNAFKIDSLAECDLVSPVNLSRYDITEVVQNVVDALNRVNAHNHVPQKDTAHTTHSTHSQNAKRQTKRKTRKKKKELANTQTPSTNLCVRKLCKADLVANMYCFVLPFTMGDISQ